MSVPRLSRARSLPKNMAGSTKRSPSAVFPTVLAARRYFRFTLLPSSLLPRSARARSAERSCIICATALVRRQRSKSVCNRTYGKWRLHTKTPFILIGYFYEKKDLHIYSKILAGLFFRISADIGCNRILESGFRCNNCRIYSIAFADSAACLYFLLYR